MEFSEDKEDDGENSEKPDWSMMFSQMLKSYNGMNITDILHLSYPQFKSLYKMIYEPKTFNMIVPYLGSGDKNDTDKIKREENKIDSKEGLFQMVAKANSIWN